MSTALEQFLDKYVDARKEAMHLIPDWQQAISRLMKQIRNWVEESDPKKVMQIEETEVEINEPGIGWYRAPKLDLGIPGGWMEIIPVARRINGVKKPHQNGPSQSATGRVDITNTRLRYLLYRFGSEEWFIQGPFGDLSVSPSAGEPPFVPLEKEPLEKAILKCLR
jgi:hypothetical protein